MVGRAAVGILSNIKEHKLHDTKDDTLLLVRTQSVARTGAEVHCFVEEVFA